MKITITYERDSSMSLETGCWAKTEMPDRTQIISCGETWEEARHSLMLKVGDFLVNQRKEVPADEEVEV